MNNLAKHCSLWFVCVWKIPEWKGKEIGPRSLSLPSMPPVKLFPSRWRLALQWQAIRGGCCRALKLLAKFLVSFETHGTAGHSFYTRVTLCSVTPHPFLIPVMSLEALSSSARGNLMPSFVFSIPCHETRVSLDSAREAHPRQTRWAVNTARYQNCTRGHDSFSPQYPVCSCLNLTHPRSSSVPFFSLPGSRAIVGSPQDGLQEDLQLPTAVIVWAFHLLVRLTFFLSCLVHEVVVPNLDLRP